MLFEPELVNHCVSERPRWWAVRERVLPEIAERHLGLLVVGGGDEAAVEICGPGFAGAETGGTVVQSARIHVDAPSGRLFVGSAARLPSRVAPDPPAAGDEGWIDLLPGRYAVEAERIAGRGVTLRLRFTPSVDAVAFDGLIPDLGPEGRRFDRHVIRSQALEQQLARAVSRQARAQRSLEEAIAGHDQFDLDQDTGELVLQGGGQPLLRAPFHAIGSYGFSSHSWRWAWANDSVAPSLRRRVGSVRDGASDEEEPWLCEPELPITLADAERIVALATARMHLGAWYAVPYELGVLFVAIEAVPVVGEAQPPLS